MSGDCEVAIFYRPSEVTARKAHKCCECTALICIGERYFNGSGKWPDSGINTYRQHLLCMSACMFIRDQFHYGECIGFGELKEWYTEAHEWLVENKRDDQVKTMRDLLAKIFRRERQRRINE